MWMLSLAFNTAEAVNGVLINCSTTVMAEMGAAKGHTKTKTDTNRNGVIIHWETQGGDGGGGAFNQALDSLEVAPNSLALDTGLGLALTRCSKQVCTFGRSQAFCLPLLGLDGRGKLSPFQ